jgi:hypothetical protein
MPSVVVRIVVHDMPVQVVRGVIQYKVGGIAMEDCNDIAFGAPLFVLSCEEIQVRAATPRGL